MIRFSTRNNNYSATSMNCNIFIREGRGRHSRMVLLSMFATKEQLRELKTAIAKKLYYTVYYDNTNTSYSFNDTHDIYTSYDKKMNYYHVLLLNRGYTKYQLTLIYKDENYIDWDINYTDIPQQIIDDIHYKLSNLYSFPIMKEWIPRILQHCISRELMTRCLINNETDTNISCYLINFDYIDLEKLISEWLKNGEISLGTNKTSDFMTKVNTVEDYLNHYYKELTRKIEASFAPRFNPETDNYSPAMERLCGYLSYAKKINLYGAQKATVQASSNALDDKNCVFIVGEQGTGKTLMSTATAYVNNANKKFMTNIVMCPGQLVEKWAREIKRIPNSKAIVVSSFEDLIAITPKIKSNKRHYHLWLVISKETAKFSYNLRPAGIYKKKPTFTRRYTRIPAYSEYRADRNQYEVLDMKEGYACPHCNKLITKTDANTLYLGIDGFSEPRSILRDGKIPNLVCPNCGTPLWQAAEKCDVDHESKWIYIAKAQGDQAKIGWIERRFVKSEYDRIINSDTRTKQEEAMLIPLKRAIDEYFAPIDVGEGYGIVSREDIKTEYKRLKAIENPTDEDKKKLEAIDTAMNIIRRSATGYSTRDNMALGEYIYKKLKNCIDYAIIDEVHELKGKDTLQGEAFAQLSRAAKKTICLTGTLTNGEASSLFYMLYRTVPKMMKENGFDFTTKSESNFVQKYGVVEEKKTLVGYKRSTAKKELPGISPAVFTEFLLENAVFVSLDDMADNLPGYEEIPMGVDMDERLNTEYTNIVAQVKHIFTGEGAQRMSGGLRSYGQVLQGLMTFPDQPYEQPPIINIETQRELIRFPELDKNTLTNKDKALLNLIREKKAAGEKVLVYYSYPGRCDHLGETLTKELKKMDISFAELTASVSAAKREAWITKKVEKDNIDVLLCNPELVKTGLDLLAFTTIVFYQPVINLSTMMQASRRSWRIGQTKDVKVYFMYYKNTVQETATKTQASRKQAAMVIQGKFNAEGLEAMANESSIAIRLINDLVEGIESNETEERNVFKSARIESRYKAEDRAERWIDNNNHKRIFPVTINKKKHGVCRFSKDKYRELSNYDDLMLAIC